MKTITSAISILTAIILASGCAEKKSNHPVSPAESPRAILKNCATAMHNIDKPTFLACFDASVEESEALASIMDLAQAMDDFKKKFISVYGIGKWNDFQDPDKAPEGGNATFHFVTKEALSEIDSVEIKINGDMADIPIPGEMRKAVAVKNQDGWLIDAKSFLPPGSKPEAFRDLMLRMVTVTRQYKKAIGHEGIAPEDIDAEVGRALLQEIGVTTPAKHKFNIDEL